MHYLVYIIFSYVSLQHRDGKLKANCSIDSLSTEGIGVTYKRTYKWNFLQSRVYIKSVFFQTEVREKFDGIKGPLTLFAPFPHEDGETKIQWSF